MTRAERRAYHRRWRARHIALGLCGKCRAKAIRGQRLCPLHAEMNRASYLRAVGTYAPVVPGRRGRRPRITFEQILSGRW